MASSLPVISRDIYNVRYHIERARRYDEHAKELGTGVASNNTNKETTVAINMSHSDTKRSSWKATASPTSGVRARLSAGVPVITERGIEISAEVTGQYEWGVDNTTTNTVEVAYNVSVPPMSKTTVSVRGTTASCDIPFSYIQADTYSDGTRHISDKTDGMYTGTNSFNKTYQVRTDPL